MNLWTGPFLAAPKVASKGALFKSAPNIKTLIVGLENVEKGQCCKEEGDEVSVFSGAGGVKSVPPHATAAGALKDLFSIFKNLRKLARKHEI